jgi:hypothetical protein
MIFYTKQTDVIAISEQSCIHFDPTVDSPTSREYVLWLAKGNEPEEWNPKVGEVE